MCPRNYITHKQQNENCFRVIILLKLNLQAEPRAYQTCLEHDPSWKFLFKLGFALLRTYYQTITNVSTWHLLPDRSQHRRLPNCYFHIHLNLRTAHFPSSLAAQEQSRGKEQGAERSPESPRLRGWHRQRGQGTTGRGHRGVRPPSLRRGSLWGKGSPGGKSPTFHSEKRALAGRCLWFCSALKMDTSYASG